MTAGASTARAGYRRTRRTACGAIVALALTFAATGTSATPASASIEPGMGSSFAGTLKIDPRTGNLSIGIDEGKSAATHQNTAAQAVSQAIDLGTIGTSLAAYGCDGSNPSLPSDQQPQPLIADTRDPNAPQSAEADETVPPGPLFHKSVAVTPDPFGKAVTTTAPLAIAGLLSIGGGQSMATSGLVDGVRVAEASADISGIDLAGVVKLSSLHWDARAASDGEPVGHFSIGSASISGTAIPTNDPSATLAQLNAVLDKIGLHLTPPSQHVDAGVLFVDPLALSVTPNATRDLIAGSLVNGIQPIRGPLFDALLKAYCKSNTEITVADIVIGSITGAGTFNLLFGGAQATQGEISANGFTLGFGGLGGATTPGVPSTPGTPGKPAVAGIPATPAPAVAAPSPTVASTPPHTAAIEPAALSKGKRGGALASVGLLTLLLLAGMAEADRRKMRRAQREVSFTS